MDRHADTKHEGLEKQAQNVFNDGTELRFVLFAHADGFRMRPLSGDWSRFGLAKERRYRESEIGERIETDQLVAHIMGKKAYFAFLEAKVSAIEDTEVFLLPWKKEGAPRWLLIRLKLAERLAEGEKKIFGEVIHIHEKTPHSLALFHSAHHDDPTELLNRKALRAHLKQIDEEETFHALFIDLDDFKRVNDTYGHILGDRILKKAADRLREERDQNKEFFRVGGDEFFALLRDMSAEEAHRYGEWLTGFFRGIDIDGDTIDLSASIGLIEASRGDCGFERLLAKADAAMYRAKAEGKATVVRAD